MVRWQRIQTHDLDNLSTQQYHEIANAHDTAGWESQRQGFTELRDLSDDLSRSCDKALTELRRNWSGGADQVAPILDALFRNEKAAEQVAKDTTNASRNS